MRTWCREAVQSNYSGLIRTISPLKARGDFGVELRGEIISSQQREQSLRNYSETRCLAIRISVPLRLTEPLGCQRRRHLVKLVLSVVRYQRSRITELMDGFDID